MNSRDAMMWVDSPWRSGIAEEQRREQMHAFIAHRISIALDPYFYWPPHCGFSIDIFLDEDVEPVLKGAERARHQLTVFVSSKAQVATFRIRGVSEKPWWESDRRWTYDRTTKVYGFAHRHAQALCDKFGLQLMPPEPQMDEPLPGRFRKLDPKGPATVFSELFSEL